MTILKSVITATSFVCLAVPAMSQVIGPMLGVKAYEIGVQYREVSRETESNSTLDMSDYAITARVGITELATLSFEGIVGDNIVGGKLGESYEDHRLYLIGAGAQTLVWKHERYAAFVSGHTSVANLFSNVESERHRRLWQVNIAALLEGTYRLYGLELTLWGGPGYFYINDELSPPQRRTLVSVIETEGNWGVTAGSALVIKEHFVLQLSALYNDEFQPRFMLALRL